MTLNSRNVDAVRRLLQTGRQNVGLERASDFTLPGVLELVATAVSSNSSNGFAADVARLAKERGGALQSAWNVWTSAEDALLVSDIHGTRSVEFFRFRVREDQTGHPYQLYQERFVRSLKEAGFPRKFAEAVAGALVEMSDNVIQHSQRESGEFTGLAGYSVESGYMAFGVIDVGQGVLAKLSRAPAWSKLRTAEAALKAVVYEHASSRPDQPEGEGFRTLIRALVDRSCCMRFRSDDTALCIADGGNQRQGVISSSPRLNGFQMSVCCVLGGQAEERSLK